MVGISVDLARVIHRTGRALALASCLALGACGPGEGATSLLQSLGLVAAAPQPTESQPTATTPILGKQLRIGRWRELLLAPDGTFDRAAYVRIANNYNSPEMLDYRLGPTAADFANGKPLPTAPTVYQPESKGLWKGGLDPALADRFCVTPDRLPHNDAEDQALYGPGFQGGGGWIMSGQMLFSPDANAPADMSAGVANMRAFDGALAITTTGADVGATGAGDTRAMCMRMRAEWVGDWWNRNGISAPTAPAVVSLRQRFPDLPLPAVATARGDIQSSVTGFLAFRNGVIAAAGTGNDPYSGIGNGAVEPLIQLPAGKVPTAMALTAMNEFLFVTVWDVNAVKGQLAVIAVGPDDPANIGPSDTGRYGWGVQSWPVVRGLKLLGFVDLPMVAPNSVSVALSTGTRKFRGDNTWRGPELTTQSGRDAWNARSVLDYDAFLPLETHWKNLASAGYVAVGSRAEDKVAIINLRPLLDFYRTMYLTTQANWDQTANSNQGAADNRWPYTFAFRPEQMPVVLGTLDIRQPTSLMARQKRLGSNTRAGWVVHERWNEAGKRLTIASMDGTIQQFDVTSLVNPVLQPVMPTAPIARWQTGVNPTQVTSPIGGDYFSDDIFVVSRGTRKIFVSDYRGEALATLDDARLVDPVAITIGVNFGGYYDRGPDRSVTARVLTVLDYNGKIVHDYGMFIDPLWIRRYQPDYAIGQTGWSAEQWRYTGPDGRPGQTFQYGYGNPLPGKPFMFSFDEVI